MIVGVAAAILSFQPAAHAGPLKFGFYQGGYEEGAFVAGFFHAEDRNGDGQISHDGEIGNCTFAPIFGRCEVTRYFMTFSGNSLVSAFTHKGLGALQIVPGGDSDNWVGVWFQLGDKFIPELTVVAPGSGYPESIAYLGNIGSQNWTLDDHFYDPGIRWSTNTAGACSRSILEPRFPEVICGQISNNEMPGGGRTRTSERVRLVRVTEPATVILFGLGLACFGVIRRKQERRREATVTH